MVEIARDYLACMGIHSQYVIGRHYDSENPHCHIAFNMIDVNGLRISDSHNYKRNELACKKLKLKYGLYFAETKSEDINIANLRKPQKTRHEIYFAIDKATRYSTSWNELVEYLKSEQIEVQFKYKSNSTEIQGVSFSKNGYVFSGSKIDRKFSYSKLNNLIEAKKEDNISIPERKVQNVEEVDQTDFTPYTHQYKDDEYDITNPRRKNNKRKNNKTLNR